VFTVFAPNSPSHTSPSFHWYQPPDRTCSTLLFSDFVKKKKKTFLFF
jgi:hypothetical protein